MFFISLNVHKSHERTETNKKNYQQVLCVCFVCVSKGRHIYSSELRCCPKIIKEKHISEQHCCPGWSDLLFPSSKLWFIFESIPPTPSCCLKYSLEHRPRVLPLLKIVPSETHCFLLLSSGLLKNYNAQQEKERVFFKDKAISLVGTKRLGLMHCWFCSFHSWQQEIQSIIKVISLEVIKLTQIFKDKFIQIIKPQSLPRWRKVRGSFVVQFSRRDDDLGLTKGGNNCLSD